jgi:hypothetical protein
MRTRGSEAEVREIPEWRHNGERSPTYNDYWNLWNSLEVGDGMLERRLESADGRFNRVEVIFPEAR